MMPGMSLDEIERAIPANISDIVDVEAVRKIRESVRNDTGQTLESDLLKPCPFCGGEAFVQTSTLGDCDEEARVVCSRCHVSTRREFQPWRMVYSPTGEDLTRTIAIARAIKSWNVRTA